MRILNSVSLQVASDHAEFVFADSGLSQKYVCLTALLIFVAT